MIEKNVQLFNFKYVFISKIKTRSSHLESFCFVTRKKYFWYRCVWYHFRHQQNYLWSYGKYTHTHPLPADKSDVGHDIGMTCCGGKYSPLRISQLHHVEQITTIKYAESDWFKRSLLTRVTWHNWNPESPSIVESDRICLVAFSVEINRNFES